MMQVITQENAKMFQSLTKMPVLPSNFENWLSFVKKPGFISIPMFRKIKALSLKRELYKGVSK